MSSQDVLAATAANRDVDGNLPGPYQDCREVVHIAVFFDGTGNNRTEDDATARWSNVARIFEASFNEPSKGIYRIYVSGVGTKFNGDLPNWIETQTAMIQDGLPGMGVGTGGDRRMEFGYAQVNDRLRDFLIMNAEKQGGEVAKYANAAGDKGFVEINRALGHHRLIKMINLSIFGFSRGAALARAFSNRIIRRCTRENGGLAYVGYPIRFNFLGLFDTVASFGVPSKNARTPFSERELIVSAEVERCIHYVAAHEVRFAFPVDLIRKDGKLAGNWIEKTYPGVHSDVGGGYDPTSQGIDNNYSRIPMRDMMGEAIQSGVRMRSYREIARVRAQLFTTRFECRTETAEAYRRYMASFGSPSGGIEKEVLQHMKLLYSAYGTMHRLGIETPGQRQLRADKYKLIGPKGMAWEVEKYRAFAKVGKAVRFGIPLVGAYAQFIKPQDWQLECWDANATDGVVGFVANYVHDSKVDFIVNVGDPFSYFSARGIQESTVSVWAGPVNWIGDKVGVVRTNVNDGIAKSKEVVTTAIDNTTEAAKRTAASVAEAARDKAAVAKRRANEAAEVAQRELQRAKQFGVTALDETAKAARSAAFAAQQRADQAAEYAKKVAREAGEAADTAIDVVESRVNAAGKATNKMLDETTDGAERLIDSGISWIRSSVRDLTDDEPKHK